MSDATLRLRVASPEGRLSWFALGVLVSVAVMICLPQIVTAQDPSAQDILRRLAPPSLDHLFGTDALGRDLFARVVHGARASLVTAVLALAFAFGLSLAIGLTAGYCGGRVDRALMRVIDVLLAVPSLLLSLLIVSGLGTGPVPLAIAVGTASVPSFALLTRAEVLRISTQPFVEAAAGYGLPQRLVLTRHILPHARGPLLTLSALELATMVLAVSTLSFLGYGTRPPDPEWGNLIAEGREHFATAWWLTALPGLVLAGVVLALHRLARGRGATGLGIV